MKTIIFLLSVLLIAGIFFSCAWQTPAFYIPVPDFSVYDSQNIIETDNITGMDVSMPQWLLAFIEKGIWEVEELPAYEDKYVFIGVNRGTNFTALSMWAQRFSTAQDLALLATDRIERRMVLNSTLYPDNEYGRFFDAMIIAASNNEYRGAVKEDTYWYGTNSSEQNEDSSLDVYYFFVLITIDKIIMQDIVENIMNHANTVSVPTASQAAAINSLMLNFFDGF